MAQTIAGRTGSIRFFGRISSSIAPSSLFVGGRKQFERTEQPPHFGRFVRGETEIAAALAGRQLAMQPANRTQATARPVPAAGPRRARRRSDARESSLRRGRWPTRGRTCLATRSMSGQRANHRPPNHSRAARRSRADSASGLHGLQLRRRPGSNSMSVSQIRRHSDVGHELRLMPVAAASRLTSPSGLSSPPGPNVLAISDWHSLPRRPHRRRPRPRPAIGGPRRRFAWPSERRIAAANCAARRPRCTKDRACRFRSAGRAE